MIKNVDVWVQDTPGKTLLYILANPMPTLTNLIRRLAFGLVFIRVSGKSRKTGCPSIGYEELVILPVDSLLRKLALWG